MAEQAVPSDHIYPKEDQITDLNDGPWPGPIERPVVSGELSFGQVSLTKTAGLQVKKHCRGGRHWYRTASAIVTPDVAERGRWTYDTDITITERGEKLLHGVCVSAKHLPDGSLEMKFHDSSWELEHQPLTAVFFGMTNKEMMFWIPQFAGFAEPKIQGFTQDRELRPFIYAVPIMGLGSEGDRKLVGANDLGVVAGEADDTIYPIVDGLKIADRYPLWNRAGAKAFGVVMAQTMLEAERLALGRASLTVDIVNFALRAGVSHWENRRDRELLEWNREVAEVDVKLSDWILIREVKSAKGWVRIPVTSARDAPLSLDTVHDRITAFLKRFQTVTTVGDVLSQTGRRPLSESERRLIDGIQRALHWYGIAAKERGRLDRFLALWVTLEAILDCASYPKVFDGNRQPIKSSLEEGIRSAPYPKPEDPLLLISADILKGRLLAGGWPLTRRLELFAKSFGVSLHEGDTSLVQGLGSLRGQVLHGGKHEADIAESSLRALAYLTERLIMAASVCAYKKLEDNQRHILHLEPIGPEVGAAPLVLDGRQVAYEFHMQKTKSGEQKSEWVIDGLVYDESNSQIE